MPFQIIRNDITKMDVDAIVNTANPQVAYGAGVDEAIYKAAGQTKLLEARKAIGPMEVGEVALTDGFNLPARRIIHNVGPHYVDGTQNEDQMLARCYQNCLALAKEKGFASIAFPLIASGTYGFPKDVALKVAITEFSSFLANSEMMIYLVVYDRKSFEASGQFFADVSSYIDEQEVKEKTRERALAFREKLRQTFGSSNRSFPSSSGRIDKEQEESMLLQEDELMPQASEMIAQPYMESRKLEDIMENVGENFPEMLLRLIDERGMKNSEVYHNANVSAKVFSKIITNPDYHPKKNTVLALAIGLRLTIDETIDLLSRAGYALSPGDRFDLLIRYCIEHDEYNIVKINILLFEYDQPCLID